MIISVSFRGKSKITWGIKIGQPSELVLFPDAVCIQTQKVIVELTKLKPVTKNIVRRINLCSSAYIDIL